MHRRFFPTLALMLLPAILCGCSRPDETSHRKNERDGVVTPIPNSASSPIATRTAAPTPAPSSEQRFPLRDGRTAVVDQDDHVLLLGSDGGVGTQSWCGMNGISYRRAVAFLTKVVQLIEAPDKNALADLVSLPLRANPVVNSRAEFLDRYGHIFPQSEVDAVSAADPGAVFCRNGAFMLGDGLIWAQPDETGAYKVTTVNRSFRKPRR
jgi:hypothetical protein